MRTKKGPVGKSRGMGVPRHLLIDLPVPALGDRGMHLCGGVLKEPRPGGGALPKVTRLEVEEVDLPPRSTERLADGRSSLEGRGASRVP